MVTSSSSSERPRGRLVDVGSNEARNPLLSGPTDSEFGAHDQLGLHKCAGRTFEVPIDEGDVECLSDNRSRVSVCWSTFATYLSA